MVADVLTKSLPGRPFNTLILIMGVEGEGAERATDTDLTCSNA